MVLSIVLGLLSAYVFNLEMFHAFLIAFVICIISAVICTAGNISKYITIALLMVGIVVSGFFAIQRHDNPEEYDFNATIRRDT